MKLQPAVTVKVFSYIAICIISAGFILTGSAAYASETDDSNEEIVLDVPADDHPHYSLEQITVTGTKNEKRLKDSPVFTEIIDKEEIKRSNASTLSEVLESHGLMYTSNAMGDYITIQGMGGGRVLFLVDGRRVSGRVAQRINGATMPVGDIQQIEIVRGAQSALYGSDGIGGVINIITVPPEEKFSARVRMQNSSLPVYRSQDSDDGENNSGSASPLREQTVDTNVTFGAGPFRNRISLQGGRGELYMNESESCSILPEYMSGKAGFETSFNIGETNEFSLGGNLTTMRTDEQTNVQGSLSRQDINRYEGFIKGKHMPGDNVSLNIQVYDNFYERDKKTYSGIMDTWDEGEYELENIIAGEIYGNIDLSDNLMIVAGIEGYLNTMEREVLSLENDNGNVSRNGQALVLQGEWYNEEVYSLIAGLRTERDSQYGIAAAPRIAAMYYLKPELRLLAGLGVGYRAPDFNDLYLYNNQITAMPYTIAGNPDLDPEYSTGGNIGFEYSAQRYFFQGNFYYTELFQEIIYEDTGIVDLTSGKIIYRTGNLERSLRAGFDTEARSRLFGPFFASLGYNYLFAYNRTESSEIREQPAHTARGRIGAENRDRGYYFHFTALYFSPVDPDDEDYLAEHRYRLDLYGSKGFGKHFEGFFSVENLTGYINPSLGPYFGPVFTLGIETSL